MLYTLQPDESAASLTGLHLQTRARQLVSGFFIKRPCKSLTKFLLRRYNQGDYRLCIDLQLLPQLSVGLQSLHFLKSALPMENKAAQRPETAPGVRNWAAAKEIHRVGQGAAGQCCVASAGRAGDSLESEGLKKFSR